MKTLKFIAAAAFAIAIAPAFTSCKSDDAPDEPNKAESSVIDGTHVTSINNLTIGYDQYNRPVSFETSTDGEYISIDYANNKIYFDDGEIDVKFNDKGFITEMSSSWDEKEEYNGESYHYKGEGKITFSYNKDNCLTSMKENSSETEKYSGSKENKYTLDAKVDFTWSAGNLVKIYAEEKENDNGDKQEEHYTADIEYGESVNPYKQFPLSIVAGSDIEFNELFAVGLFGNGPAYLPSKITATDEDGDTYAVSVSFDLNDNGSLAAEKAEGRTIWSYGYSNVTRSADMSGNVINLNQIKRMFRHYSRK